MSTSEANSSRNDVLPTVPSGEWEMNVFLSELADELTTSDLKKMKHLLTGFNGTRKRVLEEIEDALDLFQHLRQKQIVTIDNIVYLQAMLWHTGRKDLHNKFVKFAKKRGNIIHFYAPNERPENGFEYIKFHIAGKEKMDRRKLDELRFLVSHALCVPIEFVFACGIEATNSILVTFMIPEGYGNVLSDLDDKEKDFLGSRGVDAIWYNGQLISCIDVKISEEDESIRKDEEVKILLDQKSNLEQDVESLQVEVLKLIKALRFCKKESEMIKREAKNRVAFVTSALIRQYVDMKYTPEKLSLQAIALKNAVKYSSNLIRKMEEKGYDVNLIQCLLEANEITTRMRSKSLNAWIETQQQAEIEKMKQDLVVLRLERDKLAYFLRVGISNPVLTENEDFFMRFLQAGLQTQIQETTTTIEMPPEGVGKIDIKLQADLMCKILQTWNQYLNEKEKKILMKSFLPTAKDQKAYQDSKLPLLHYLWQKRLGSDSKADFCEWIVLVLSKIKRLDLLHEWTEMSEMLIKAFEGNVNQEENYDRNLSRKEQKDQTREVRRPQSTKNVPKNVPNFKPIRPKVQKSDDERLQHIEEMLENLSVYLMEPKFQSGKTDAFLDWSKLAQSKLFT